MTSRAKTVTGKSATTTKSELLANQTFPILKYY